MNVSKEYGHEVFVENTSRVSLWKVMRGTVDGYAVPVDNKHYPSKEEAVSVATEYASKWGDTYKGVYLYDEENDERKEVAA